MKVYFHFSLIGFSNSYIVGCEQTKQALIIDPGKITNDILSLIENNHYSLNSVFLTHNHASHCCGLQTLKKIYSPKIYSADYELSGSETVLRGDGVIRIGNLNVVYMSIPGHTSDSMVFKIGNILFTGDSLSAGMLGPTNNTYAQKILQSNILSKILSQQNDLIVMPGHGPPSSINAEKKYNLSVGCPLVSDLLYM